MFAISDSAIYKDTSADQIPLMHAWNILFLSGLTVEILSWHSNYMLPLHLLNHTKTSKAEITSS